MSSSNSEKGALLPWSAPHPAHRQRRYRGRRAGWILLAALVSACLCTLARVNVLSVSNPFGYAAAEAELSALCPQVAPLIPVKNREVWESLGETIKTPDFLTRAVDWLGGAVRVATPSFDEMLDVGVDPRWEVFGPFHDYLLGAFPKVHASLEFTKVNTYGLVYVWTGSDASLKPLLLTAHQDVVPVNPDTYDKWVHPPFSGYFDGTRIWGRGSRDDKSGLIGSLSAVEALLERGFKPTRSVVLAFGFDEETSGLHGAYAIGQYLLSTYGENAFAMLVDEGGKFGEEHGGVFARPSIAEKGYIDIRLTVTSPGGHSSIPPAHTTIGILAALLVEYEEHPIEAHLKRDTPVYWHAQCLAAHAPELSPSLRRHLARSVKSDKALRKAQEELFEDHTFEALVGTTQAIDLIDGGVKTNALPENAVAVINHRIATDSSVGAVKERATALFKSVAAGFNLSYTAFGSRITDVDARAYGTLTLTDAFGTALEPAPLTPTGPDAAPFLLLSGSIKATYNDHRALLGDGITVMPSLVSGNTDTRYYWPLTQHIFRYSHTNGGNGTGLEGVHTINEAIPIVDFLEIIRWFTTLILNADESTTL
ncbi:Carboxypeptidase S [Sparassis crispa]|uniref:Carboxypeptidase S n=1 Tax=Sparassis crispa TaxID=139825 RepID=A0A401GWK3_9APHY|nr:Carboxypeptidase S [Sparassis crispa]GBE86580.1 Carboxypeptidase S [Sparassis crispa]